MVQAYKPQCRRLSSLCTGQYLVEAYGRKLWHSPAFSDSTLDVCGERYGRSDKWNPVWDRASLLFRAARLSLRYGILYAGQDAGEYTNRSNYSEQRLKRGAVNMFEEEVETIVNEKARERHDKMWS